MNSCSLMPDRGALREAPRRRLPPERKRAEVWRTTSGPPEIDEEKPHDNGAKAEQSQCAVRDIPELEEDDFDFVGKGKIRKAFNDAYHADDTEKIFHRI